MTARTGGRRPPPPPYAAIELHRDQVAAGLKTFRKPGTIVTDQFEIAAEWERRAVAAPVVDTERFARIGRAWLTSKSPRTRRGRWRRDLAYLEMIEAEATATLSALRAEKYALMVADWRKREPRGMFARYVALRNQKRQQAEDGGKAQS